MHRIGRNVCFILTGLIIVVLLGGIGSLHSKENKSPQTQVAKSLPLLITHRGDAPALERPSVAFDHDLHTAALKQVKKGDCKVCHVLEEKVDFVNQRVVKVFTFPKFPYDTKDKRSIMNAYHAGCGNCHAERAAEGKKTGPDIGMCGKCHVKRAQIEKVAWAWSPIFNYARHYKHVKAIDELSSIDKVKVVANIEVVGEIKPADKRCLVCHHTYDEKQKKLIYKQDSANSCRACHKSKDEKNARSMRKVVHAACIGCHIELYENVKKELAAQGRTQLNEQDKKKFGPFDCKGCHGEHKTLPPEELKKIPRLVRGQKDVMDVVTKDPKAARMKLVPFDHKAHEPRAQFCNTCHHYSLEKCSNCHTSQGNLKEGGGVSFERAFHKSGAVQSCVGCHETTKAGKNCAGCHQWMLDAMPKVSCPVCHRGTTEGKPIEVPPLPLVFDKEKVPEKLEIKQLEKEFKPADMPHQKIVKKLTLLSNNSPLARVFHAARGENAICSGCHHKTEMTATKKVPKCSSCHGRRFDPKELGKPGILAAYHQQCMGCHAAMDQKPKALECVKCHPAKEPQKQAQATKPAHNVQR